MSLLFWSFITGQCNYLTSYEIKVLGVLELGRRQKKQGRGKEKGKERKGDFFWVENGQTDPQAQGSHFSPYPPFLLWWSHSVPGLSLVSSGWKCSSLHPTWTSFLNSMFQCVCYIFTWLTDVSNVICCKWASDSLLISLICISRRAPILSQAILCLPVFLGQKHLRLSLTSHFLSNSMSSFSPKI